MTVTERRKRRKGVRVTNILSDHLMLNLPDGMGRVRFIILRGWMYLNPLTLKKNWSLTTVNDALLVGIMPEIPLIELKSLPLL